MIINDKINNFFDKLKVNKNHKLEIFSNIDKLSNKYSINNNFILNIIKSFIILLSFNKKKILFCRIFLDNLLNLDNKIFEDVIKFFNKISLDNIDIYDTMIEKLIIHTSSFFIYLNFIKRNLLFKIWLNIVNNCNKLIKKIKIIKMKSYILLLNEIRIFLKNYKSKKEDKTLYKVNEICYNNIKIINKYID
jgi:hypothetical protein